MTTFCAVKLVAELAGTTERAVEIAFSRVFRREAETWRGAALIVRQVHGRGGRSGLRYEVRADSLPPLLQEALKLRQAPLAGRLTHGQAAQVERDRWRSIIAPALAHPKGSHARGAAISEIVAREHLRPDGTPELVTRRTVERKIAAFEAHGMAGLGRRGRADASRKRVVVSTRWDAAVPFDEPTRERIGHALRQYVRGLHKAGESAAILRVLAAGKLGALTRGEGFDPGGDALAAICTLPENFIQAEAVFRKVHTFKRDRKAYEDNARPRIARTRDGLLPMDVVSADVHPIDIAKERDDGSIATPRSIHWYDLATGRSWLDVILLPKGQGVRNGHVIASFARMVTAWGAPRVLYVDNGSEYNWAEFIDDALKLIDNQGRRFVDRAAPWAERSSNIVRARAYNAPAKPNEGFFSVFERHYLSVIPGWIGGDRMKKKVATIGRAPDPFPGTFEELRATIADCLALYHAMPQKGALKDRSPNQAYADAVAAGWCRTEVDPDALRIAFSTTVTREVRQGAIQHGGRSWTCPELQAYPGDRVAVLVPKYEDWSRLPIRDPSGRLIGFAEERRPYHVLDPAGAEASEAGARLHRAGMRAMDRSVPDLDVMVERRRHMKRQPEPVQAPTQAVLSYSEEVTDVIMRSREPAAQRQAREERTLVERNKRMTEIAQHFKRPPRGG